jgi:hypothetical protein
VGFFGTIKETLARGPDLFFAHSSGLQPLFDKALADVTHCVALTVQGFGHVLSGAIGSIRINLEQDVSMLDLIGRSLPLPGQF